MYIDVKIEEKRHTYFQCKIMTWHWMIKKWLIYLMRKWCKKEDILILVFNLFGWQISFNELYVKIVIAITSLTLSLANIFHNAISIWNNAKHIRPEHSWHTDWWAL